MENKKNKLIEYSDKYIAFLDVLGFKNIVMNSNDISMQRLSEYFEIVNNVITNIEGIENKKGIEFIVISDSIIMSIEQGQSKCQKLNALRSLCIAVGLIQRRLARINVWLRGGISSGKAYFDSVTKQIVGPAYIKAYLLEEEMAIYPRVIMDNKIIGELGFRDAASLVDSINKTNEGGLNYSNWGTNILYRWFEQGENSNKHLNHDVAIFIDYLGSVLEICNEELKIIVEHLSQNLYLDNKVYLKYRWVCDYLKTLSDRARGEHGNGRANLNMYILDGLY